MRKLLAILAIVLLPATTVAQVIDLYNKEWYSRSEEGAAPPQWQGDEYLHIPGWQIPAGTMCIPQSDAACNLFTTPGAGAIWEVRIRDGNGATLADVTILGNNIPNANLALDTAASVFGLNIIGGGVFSPVEMIADQADGTLNTTGGLATTSFVYGFNGATWDRIDAPAHADNLANTLDGLNTSAFNYAWDGTTWDRVRVGAVGEVQVTDVAVRPGEDAGNDWRKFKKEQTAVVTPAKTTTTVDSLEDVLASREILSDVNWTVCAENTGGAALTALNIEVSSDGVIWRGLTAAPAAGYSGVRADGWSATLAAAAIGCYSVGFNSYRYLRVQANCGTTTTLDVWYTANKN